MPSKAPRFCRVFENTSSKVNECSFRHGRQRDTGCQVPVEVDWRIRLPRLHVLLSKHRPRALWLGERFDRSRSIQRFVLGNQRHGLVSPNTHDAQCRHGVGGTGVLLPKTRYLQP